MRVMKFGGTSVGDAECIRRAAKIIAEAAENGPVVAVVSAMSGVTNRLVEAAKQSATGDDTAQASLAEFLRARHDGAIDRLVSQPAERDFLKDELGRIIDEVAAMCHSTALLRELTARTLDRISSTGERLSARLVAAALREVGADGEAIEATELIVTTDDFGRADPEMIETQEKTRARLLPLVEEKRVPVVTGFIGATTKGILTTLGRGGSDYSATIIGAALGAEEVIIWTDVDGVLTADPRLVKQARLLREISYNEAGELAYFGAKVLHPKTLRPVADAGIPVWIRNSFAPSRPGTKITREGRPTDNGVKAITAIANVSLITVGGRGIVGLVGIAAKTFLAAASVRANILLISQSSSENDICFIVESGDAEKTIEALQREFLADLVHKNVEHITVDHDIAIVAVVGDRMRGTPGIAGRTFSALGRRGINIIAIAQGSSEYNVSFVVEASAIASAVEAVHREFNLEHRSSRFESPESAFART